MASVYIPFSRYGLPNQMCVSVKFGSRSTAFRYWSIALSYCLERYSTCPTPVLMARFSGSSSCALPISTRASSNFPIAFR